MGIPILSFNGKPSVFWYLFLPALGRVLVLSGTIYKEEGRAVKNDG